MNNEIKKETFSKKKREKTADVERVLEPGVSSPNWQKLSSELLPQKLKWTSGIDCCKWTSFRSRWTQEEPWRAFSTINASQLVIFFGKTSFFFYVFVDF
jgi:hypothetical protein